MRWPVHVQQDHRLLIRLGHDGVQVKFGPVERRDGRWHGKLLRKVVRVQVADMHQAGSPGQPGRNEHGYARECGREYHVPTLTRWAGSKVTGNVQPLGTRLNYWRAAPGCG